MIPDWKIRELGLIDNFIEEQTYKRRLGTGLSSFGYDLRLSSKEFKYITRYTNQDIIDPKGFNRGLLEDCELKIDPVYKDAYFILPPLSYGLGVSIEHITVPSFLTGRVVGKSTYARSGIICPITPIEAGWKGYLTIELFNATPLPVKIYANEGCCQVLFEESSEGECETNYDDRSGKYQNQKENIQIAKVN